MLSEKVNPALSGGKWLVSLLLFSSSGGLFLSFLLESGLGKFARVEREFGAAHITDLLDVTLGAELSHKNSGDGSTNLELFHDD